MEPTQGCQKCDSSVGCIGTLDGLVGSHNQTSHLSHPCNPLLEGCDPCFAQYLVQGDVGSDLPSYHQTTEVTLTEGSTERSGYMHMKNKSHIPFWVSSSP